MLRDPFTVEDESILYVPRAASERVLAELVQALRCGTNPVALIGAVGIGKSLLFKVSAQRLASQACCVPVRYEGWSVAELCQWVIRELDARETLEGERALAHRPTLVKFREWMQRERSYLQKGDPETALLELAGDLQGRGFPIVLLVDDADSMKPDTAARLVELTAQSNGSLVLGLALTEGAPGAGALRGALAPGLKEIRFFEPMTLEETTAYVKERLAKVGASRELRACLDDSRIRRIYRYTEGNPRRVHGEIGLLHLELSRVRAGLPLREGDAPHFEDEHAPASLEARPVVPTVESRPAPERMPAPSWQLREEERTPAPVAPPPLPEPEVDETEVVLAALTPIPEPEPVAVPVPISVQAHFPAPVQETPVPPPPLPEPPPVSEVAPPAAGSAPALEEPAELELEPVLEDLAELAEDGEEIELEVVAIEGRPEPESVAVIEPPAAPPPAVFGVRDPEPTPVAAPEPEPHLISPETLASLHADAAHEEEPAREASPASPILRVVTPGEPEPSPELHAAVRRDWEDLSQRSAPLASVHLPPDPARDDPAPLRRVAAERAPEPSRASWIAAGGVVIAAGLALVFWLTAREPAATPQTGLPGVGSPLEEAAAPAALEPAAPAAPAVAEPAPRPTPAPAPASDGGAEPSMIATSINAKPWARIEIDGVDVGETPLGEFPLREGNHQFRAFLSDGRIIERTERITRQNYRVLFE